MTNVPIHPQRRRVALHRLAVAVALLACSASVPAGEASAPRPKKFSEVIKSAREDREAKETEERETPPPEPPAPKERGKGQWPIGRDAAKAAPAPPKPLDRVPEAEVPSGKVPPKVVQRREVPAGDAPAPPAQAPAAKGPPVAKQPTGEEAKKTPPGAVAPEGQPRPEEAATLEPPKAEPPAVVPPKHAVPEAEVVETPVEEPPPKAEPGDAPDEATYGTTKDNPILIGPGTSGGGQVSGLLARIEAAKAFLHRLRDAKLRPFQSQRIGSVVGKGGHPIDRYELTSEDGKRQVIYVDMHAPAAEARPRAPKGMVLEEPEAEPAEE